MSEEQLLHEVQCYMQTCRQGAGEIRRGSPLACDLRGNVVILREALSGGFTANRVYGMAQDLHDELLERWGERYMRLLNTGKEQVA